MSTLLTASAISRDFPREALHGDESPQPKTAARSRDRWGASRPADRGNWPAGRLTSHT